MFPKILRKGRLARLQWKRPQEVARLNAEWQNQQMRWAGCKNLVSRPIPSWRKLPAGALSAPAHSRCPSISSALCLDGTPKENESSHSWERRYPDAVQTPHSLTLTPSNITCFLPHVLQREGFERLQNPEISRELQAPGVKRFYLAKKQREKERVKCPSLIFSRSCTLKLTLLFKRQKTPRTSCDWH